LDNRSAVSRSRYGQFGRDSFYTESFEFEQGYVRGQSIGERSFRLIGSVVIALIFAPSSRAVWYQRSKAEPAFNALALGAGCFVGLNDGASLPTKLTIRFGLPLGCSPALKRKFGHHHLLIDTNRRSIAPFPTISTICTSVPDRPSGNYLKPGMHTFPTVWGQGYIPHIPLMSPRIPVTVMVPEVRTTASPVRKSRSKKGIAEVLQKRTPVMSRRGPSVMSAFRRFQESGPGTSPSQQAIGG
jgi:hypothetical protein